MFILFNFKYTWYLQNMRNDDLGADHSVVSCSALRNVTL